MLASLLPLIESLGGEGAATSLGRGSGVGNTLGRLLGGSQIQAFGSQQELGGALRQITDLSSNLSAARDAMTAMRDEHEQLRTKAIEDERLYGFRDPVEHQRMADLQRQQIENARQMQLQQQSLEGLQARAAVSMDPALQAQQQRQARFQRAGALAVGGQIVQSAGPSLLRNLPGVEPAAELMGFGMGQTNAQIAGSAANAATTGASNIAGAAMKGASVGSIAGPIGAGVGAVVGGLGAASSEIAKLPSRIVDWSEALLDSQRSISRFSAPAAQAEAMRDVRKLQRDFASAQDTGGAAAGLSHSLDDLYDELRPIRDAATNVIANGLTTAVKTLTDISSTLKAILESDVAVGALAATLGPVLSNWLGVIANNTRPKAADNRDVAGLLDAINRFKNEDRSIPRQAPRR